MVTSGHTDQFQQNLTKYSLKNTMNFYGGKTDKPKQSKFVNKWTKCRDL